MNKQARETNVTPGVLSSAWRSLWDRAVTSPYLRNNVLLLSTNILAGIFAYLLHPFLGRLMGIQEYGQVAALIALSVVLATPTQIIAIIAAKYAAPLAAGQERARLNDFIRRLTPIFLAVGFVITGVLTAFGGYVAAYVHLTSPVTVVLLGPMYIVLFGMSLNQGTLQGLQRFGWYAGITLIAAFLRLILPVALVVLGLSINGAIVGLSASVLLAYLVSFWPLGEILTGARTSIGSLRSLWTYSILVTVAYMGFVALYNLDTVLARHFLSADNAGLYAALAAIGRTVLLITMSVATVMFPRVVALNEQGKPHAHVAVQAMVGVVILSASVEVLFLLAPTLITRVLFGEAFVPVASQLPLYGLAMLLLSITQVLIMYFLAVGNRVPVLIIFPACALEYGLIAWRQAEIVHFVQAVFVTSLALFVILLAIWLIDWHRT